MKRFNLVFSFLILFSTVGALKAFAGDTAVSSPQLHVARSSIYQLLLINGGQGSGGPAGEANGGGSGGSGNGTGSGSGGGTPGTPVVVVPPANQIVVRTPAGRSFNLTKLNGSGEELAATAAEWSCLRDNSNGLVWEVKTGNGGLHNQEDSFSWYNTSLTDSSVGPGFADNSGASCEGYVAGDPSTYCNTQAFVQRVNTGGWCGQQDWRMPSIDELKTLVSLNEAAPGLYSSLFPKGTNRAVWSSSPVDSYPGFAWHIYLNDGYAHGNDESGNLPVLLVRNAQ
jgi:hypothetical protein